jgi:hypothetical protein
MRCRSMYNSYSFSFSSISGTIFKPCERTFHKVLVELTDVEIDESLDLIVIFRTRSDINLSGSSTLR